MVFLIHTELRCTVNHTSDQDFCSLVFPHVFYTNGSNYDYEWHMGTDMWECCRGLLSGNIFDGCLIITHILDKDCTRVISEAFTKTFFHLSQKYSKQHITFLKHTASFFRWDMYHYIEKYKLKISTSPCLLIRNLFIGHLLTYPMVQSPSWTANWFAASQEIPRISRNPKVHYRTHKRPPPVCILGQTNPVHIPTSNLLEIRLNIIHPSTPRSHIYWLHLFFVSLTWIILICVCYILGHLCFKVFCFFRRRKQFALEKFCVVSSGLWKRKELSYLCMILSTRRKKSCCICAWYWPPVEKRVVVLVHDIDHPQKKVFLYLCMILTIRRKKDLLYLCVILTTRRNHGRLFEAVGQCLCR